MDAKQLISSWKGQKVQLALAVGVSVQTLRYWELGVTAPNEENMKKLKQVVEAQ